MTSFQDLDLNKTYTYADYMTWKFQERVELFLGKVVKMSPAPNMRHQEVATVLTVKFFNFLEGKKCKVFSAPFDVRLPLPKDKQTPDKINTVVQPDITVVCDLNKLDEQGCKGAPDLVVEVLSPGNTKKEMRDKLRIYQNAGIPAYWLIDPEHEFILLYHLDKKGMYNSSLPYVEEDIIESQALKGFKLDVEEVFRS